LTSQVVPAIHAGAVGGVQAHPLGPPTVVTPQLPEPCRPQNIVPPLPVQLPVVEALHMLPPPPPPSQIVHDPVHVAPVLLHPTTLPVPAWTFATPIGHELTAVHS
jgi:hypothetical protein